MTRTQAPERVFIDSPDLWSILRHCKLLVSTEVKRHISELPEYPEHIVLYNRYTELPPLPTSELIKEPVFPGASINLGD